MALMLLAALGPRAVADEPDVIDGLSSPIDSAVDPAADPPPPVAAAGDGGGDEHGGPVADATTGGWTLTVVLTARDWDGDTGQGTQLSPALVLPGQVPAEPPTVAAQPQAGTTSGQVAAGRDQPDPARQDQQHRAVPSCAGGGCSNPAPKAAMMQLPPGGGSEGGGSEGGGSEEGDLGGDQDDPQSLLRKQVMDLHWQVLDISAPVDRNIQIDRFIQYYEYPRGLQDFLQEAIGLTSAAQRHAIAAKLVAISGILQGLEPEAAGDPEAHRYLQLAKERIDQTLEKLWRLGMSSVAVTLDPRSPGIRATDVKPSIPPSRATDLKTTVPSFNVTALKTTVPPSRKTDLPSTSELYRMTLIERLADTLGLDPRIVAVATTAGGMAAIAESLPALALRFGLKVCVVCGLMQNNLPTDQPGAPPRSTPG
ncbi:MAG TPA: hypothetical protein VKG45_12165 [Actinomycetes bacterium]|nr:hypothetical protein [Actinomycetes bacterium]